MHCFSQKKLLCKKKKSINNYLLIYSPVFQLYRSTENEKYEETLLEFYKSNAIFASCVERSCLRQRAARLRASRDQGVRSILDKNRCRCEAR